MEKSAVLCRYFLHGACRQGEQCPFSHNLNSKPSMVCKFYLQGTCSYGKQCRYDHKRPPPPTHIDTHPTSTDSPKKMTSLTKKDKKTEPESASSLFRKDSWMDAVEFIPGKKAHVLSGHESHQFSSYACATHSDAPLHGSYYQLPESTPTQVQESVEQLCPYVTDEQCPDGNSCCYLHALKCDVCDEFCLHPLDEEQQNEHRKSCLEAIEKDMELAFAFQRSQAVSCSICLEVIMEKVSPTDKFFGIMENCNHPFCLGCIRKWRGSTKQERSVVRACPICRVPSGFITPSDVWVEDEKEKKELIKRYHEVLSTKPCRYYDEGKGSCPFGSSCFYKHALPDGTIDPKSPDLRYFSGDCDSGVLRDHNLWQFIEARELQQYEA